MPVGIRHNYFVWVNMKSMVTKERERQRSGRVLFGVVRCKERSVGQNEKRLTSEYLMWPVKLKAS